MLDFDIGGGGINRLDTAAIRHDDSLLSRCVEHELSVLNDEALERVIRRESLNFLVDFL